MVDLTKPIEPRPDSGSAWACVTDACVLGTYKDDIFVGYEGILARFTRTDFERLFRNVPERGRCWGFFYGGATFRLLSSGWGSRDSAERERGKSAERGETPGPVFEIVEPEGV